VTQGRGKPVDEADLVRSLAKHCHFSVEDVEAARAILNLRVDDFVIRFTTLVDFADEFGLDVEALAEFVAANTSGIKPWVSPNGPTESAWEALIAGDLAAAESQAKQMLEAARSRSGQWDEGNLIHHAHLVLGHLQLRAGDVTAAEEHLLAAGRTPGSPQLDSFGPNMTLAKALLQLGRKEAVLEYFRECATFWQTDLSRLAKWREALQAGGTPDFGPNLAYGGRSSSLASMWLGATSRVASIPMPRRPPAPGIRVNRNAPTGIATQTPRHAA